MIDCIVGGIFDREDQQWPPGPPACESLRGQALWPTCRDTMAAFFLYMAREEDIETCLLIRVRVSLRVSAHSQDDNSMGQRSQF